MIIRRAYVTVMSESSQVAWHVLMGEVFTRLGGQGVPGMIASMLLEWLLGENSVEDVQVMLQLEHIRVCSSCEQPMTHGCCEQNYE